MTGWVFGDNSKAALITRAMAEVRRLGVMCGAQAETFSGLSGLGDLTVTCLSKLSRNRGFGELTRPRRKIIGRFGGHDHRRRRLSDIAFSLSTRAQERRDDAGD